MKVQDTQNRTDNNDGNLFQTYLKHYLPHWPLFGLLVLVFLFSALIYLKLKSPAYEVTAEILLKDQQKGVDDTNILEDLNLFGSKKIVDNEIEVLHSRTLMERVVKDLNLYAPIFQKSDFTSVSGYQICPLSIVGEFPESLTASKEKIYFSYNFGKGLISINHKSFHLNEWLSTPMGIIKFIPNPNYDFANSSSQKSDLFYFDIIGLRNVSEDLREEIDIAATSKQSTVIQLKLRDDNAQRGCDILNYLLVEYNRAAIEDKNYQAENTLSFINQRLGVVSIELDSVEQSVQDYKTKEGIVDLSAQGQEYLANSGLNDQQESQVRVQLAVLNQVEDYIGQPGNNNNNKPAIIGSTYRIGPQDISGPSLKGGGLIPSTFGIENVDLSAMVQKLYDAELEYAKLGSSVADNNPIKIALRDGINKMKPDILESIRTEKANLNAELINLKNTSNKYDAILKTIPKKEMQLVGISREQEIENNIYSFLLQKREETALSYNSAVADSRLVDKAESSIKPVSPIPILIFIISIIGAIGIGVIIVGIQDGLNQNVLFRDEIEKYSSTPVIGEIMFNKSRNPIVISENNNTLIAEQFRQLRSSLSYLRLNNKKNKILITSNDSGEGKSFVAANLALSLALTRKKILLIELDLRKPQISQIFDLNNNFGLTNYLNGETDPDHIIKQSEINDNLFLISSGPLPGNPSEILMNGKLEDLLLYVTSLFDYIVIDSAPINPVTDTSMILPLVDVTLFIIRHGITRKINVQRLDNNIRQLGFKNISIVFNGVKKRRSIGDIYSYGYGYSNSYGYYNNLKNKKRKLFSEMK